MSCSTPSMSPRRLISTATDSPLAITAHEVDGSDRRGELTSYQREAVDERRGVLGQQRLEVLLDAVLLQAGVDAEVVAGVADDLLDGGSRSVSSALGEVTVHSTWPSSVVPSRSVAGGDIQFSGL